VTRIPSSLVPAFSLSRCEHLAAVRLSGRDAVSFLHGQVSNDIENLAVGGNTLAAYCNPKGRVIALIRVVRTAPEALLLLLARDLSETVLKRLRMFVLRSKATFEPIDAVILGIPEPTLIPGFEALPDMGKALENNAGVLINVGHLTDRFVLVSSNDQVSDQIDADDDAWLAINALDAIPEVFTASSEAFLPQALNLDLVGGINFRKGCYPGQEIVARLRYLGKLKQRMLPVSFEGPSPEPGSPLSAGDTRIGHVVLAGPSARQGTGLGLVSVTFAKLDAHANDLVLEDGTKVTVYEPGYEIPELSATVSA
jgi:tRNA-modifying protein YgfZ